MKHLTQWLAGAALAAGALAPAFAQNVGISIGVNQPGVYGRIDIGNAPPPVLVYPQPMIITPAPVQRQPIYLYVPPMEQQNWRRYCGRYNACNQPVYFVQEQWVRDRYVRAHPGWREGRRDDRRDDWRDDHGPRGHAYGHDKDKHGRGHDNDKHGRGNDRGRHD